MINLKFREIEVRIFLKLFECKIIITTRTHFYKSIFLSEEFLNLKIICEFIVFH